MTIEEHVLLPELGDFESVEVTEVLVNVGDQVAVDDSLLTLESDKATLELPSPKAGRVTQLSISVGSKLAVGDLILMLAVDQAGAESAAVNEPAADSKKPVPTETPAVAPQPAANPVVEKVVETLAVSTAAPSLPSKSSGKAHASPSVRQFARKLGVDLSKVSGSGRKHRILKADIELYVQAQLKKSSGTDGGAGIPVVPDVDFARFGAIEVKARSRISKVVAANLHRSWLNVPHVTQFDEADISNLEAFRKEQKNAAQQQGVKLTLLAFLLSAVAKVLARYPDFNSSLDSSGENLIYKKYCHIGVAVDTDNGLVVPVIRDVNQKSIYQLAAELTEISDKARDKKLTPSDMQGACFTISSLGGIGGTAFTPIVNSPEVAILGVSRSQMKPLYRDGEFVPALMLPLSLSYDHRVIDGAAAAHFTRYLASLLSDIRQLLL